MEQGQLALDDDVNTKLTSWKVPENEFTGKKKVTLRGLLSHTAGLTVHGFPGYATDEPVPTLVQVLDGEKPANTGPIRVDILPGSKWRYSGGGYTVMQQMVIDVTGKPYPQFMQETVLVPLEMKRKHVRTTVAGRESQAHGGRALCGQGPREGEVAHLPGDGGGRPVDDRLRPGALRHRRAGGPAGKSGKTLSRRMARQMLTEQKEALWIGIRPGRERGRVAVRPRRARRGLRRPADRLRGDRTGCRDHDQRQ